MPTTMPPTVYVCGASREAERVAEVIAYVRELGAVVSYDWTSCAIASRHAGGDRGRPRDHAFAISTECLDAVKTSDVILWIVPEDGSTGAGFECGAGWSRGIPIVAGGPHIMATVFYTQARVSHPDDRTAAEIAVRLATMIANGERPEDLGTRKMRKI